MRVQIRATEGAIVGRLVNVRRHPNGHSLWVAEVDLGDYDQPRQIVFGGQYEAKTGELVPVAPPGARVTVHKGEGHPRTKKVRIRRYRGSRSHGMLCSLDELGWFKDGPDEVAILRRLKPGDSLDDIPPERRVDFVARPDCLFKAEAETLVMEAIRDSEQVPQPSTLSSRPSDFHRLEPTGPNNPTASNQVARLAAKD